MLTVHLLTIFPKISDSYLRESLIKRARENKILDIKPVNIRDFSGNRHNKVDDRPFGGGPGMVLQVEPIYKAVEHVLNVINVRNEAENKTAKTTTTYKPSKTRIILFSTRGKKLDSKMAKRLSKYNDLILICGRYEGVDERVAKYIADEEVSIGDFVLSGGELPALVLTEAVSRYLPGFLGKNESLEDKHGSFPTYTRPPEFVSKEGKKWKVPPVLQSGNHAEIEKWRKG